MDNESRTGTRPRRARSGFLLALVTVSVAPAQAGAGEISDPQMAALARLREASRTPVEARFERGFPRALRMSVPAAGADPIARAQAFLRDYAALYGLTNPQLALEVERIERRRPESVHFVQTIGGVPVLGAGLAVFLDGTTVTGTLGALVTRLEPGRRGPLVSRRAAEEAARAHVGDREAPVLGVTSRVIFDRSLLDPKVASSPVLVWRVSLGGSEPAQVVVDGSSGAALWSFTSTRTDAGLASFHSAIHDALGLNTDLTNCLAGTPLIGFENGFDPQYINDADAVNAWSEVKNTYTFYHDMFGRHSFDDGGAAMRAYVHAGVGNADWDPSCGLAEFSNGFPVADVVTHEFTHAVNQYTNMLAGAFQPGSLNESYGDVMAAAREGNWLIGELAPGGPARDMSNPSAPPFNDPDIMANLNPTPSDNGGVHTNAGIPNKAHFLMAQGGVHNGHGVLGMGKDKMAQVAYGSMLNLWFSAQFLDARDVSVQVVSAYAQGPGWNASNVCTVRNAWAAVGLGIGDADCDGIEDNQENDADGDFFGDSQDNCPFVSNSSQSDIDNDGLGDVCDGNADGDAWPNAGDNCPLVFQFNQSDVDSDGIGDVCDDNDHDGTPDIYDNCPGTFNMSQADQDDDNVGDACDPDKDGDGVLNGPDNCDDDYNPDQQDTDNGGWGDVCDPNPYSAADEQAFKIGLKLSNLAVQKKEIPIPIGPCPPAKLLSSAYRQAMVVEDLPKGARAWVANAQGDVVGNVAFGGSGTVSLPFRPRGGQPLYLNLALLPGFENQSVVVSATQVETNGSR